MLDVSHSELFDIRVNDKLVELGMHGKLSWVKQKVHLKVTKTISKINGNSYYSYLDELIREFKAENFQQRLDEYRINTDARSCFSPAFMDVKRFSEIAPHFLNTTSNVNSEQAENTVLTKISTFSFWVWQSTLVLLLKLDV